jgi:DNA repair protein RadA/Sms
LSAARRNTSYCCTGCGCRTPKWLGRCPECEQWDSLVEIDPESALGNPHGGAPATLTPFNELESADLERRLTGIDELDRVLGGGLVPGAVILLAGEPGIGKSTLLLQAAGAVAASGGDVLYLSGEESSAQLRSRGHRLAVDAPRISVATETRLEPMLQIARDRAWDLVVVDSIQAVRSTGHHSVAGSPAQLRESAGLLVEFAKRSGVPVIAIGHVTKDGSIAGPRLLEHVVDTVIQFDGERHHDHRILRALKNRFGPADELGVMRMTERGLVGVENPSQLFLTERREAVAGSAVLAGIEGRRPLLVEVQALVGDVAQGSPRRTSVGVDGSRLALVLAVLERAHRLELGSRDLFVNVTGGLTLQETAADLAIAAAVASAATGRPLPRGFVLAGEIGLTGEIRSVSRCAARAREALRLGFTDMMLPKTAGNDDEIHGIRVHSAETLSQAIRTLFAPEIRSDKRRRVGRASGSVAPTDDAG